MSSLVAGRYLESWSTRSQNLDILGAAYINPISPTKMNRFHHVSKWGSLQNQWLPCIMSIEFCRPHMHVSQAQIENLNLPFIASPAQLSLFLPRYPFSSPLKDSDGIWISSLASQSSSAIDPSGKEGDMSPDRAGKERCESGWASWISWFMAYERPRGYTWFP